MRYDIRCVNSDYKKKLNVKKKKIIILGNFEEKGEKTSRKDA